MKTLKALKTVTIWNCIFCFSCLLTIICLAINEYCHVDILFDIGILSVYGWAVNPLAIFFCFRCLKVYLAERKDPVDRRIIGRKWIWIFVWPVITTVLWVLGGLLFVKFTGGV